MNRQQHLTALARVLYELVRDERDLTTLKQYRQLILQATEIFDVHADLLHPDLGLELNEYHLLRIDADEVNAKSFGDTVNEILADLERSHPQSGSP